MYPGRGRIPQLVLPQVTPGFITQNTPFSSYSVAVTVCRHQGTASTRSEKCPPPSRRSHSGGAGRTVNKANKPSRVLVSGLNRDPKERNGPDVQNGGLLKPRHGLTGKH